MACLSLTSAPRRKGYRMAFPKRYEDQRPPSPAKERPASAHTQRPVAGSARSTDRYIVALLIVAAFSASYAYAQSARPSSAGASAQSASAPQNLNPQATVSGGVQKLYIDASSSFNPQTIFAKPGIPLKIQFGPGAGCTAAVQFPQFNIYKDLTQGGAEIDLGKLQPGQYQFACGMNMVFGLLVVK